MPRIHSRRLKSRRTGPLPWTVISLALLVFSSSLPTSLATTLSLIETFPVLIAPAPAPRRRRRLQNDKNATPPPSAMPSSIPSSTPATKAPTKAPTPRPTGSPTITLSPSSAPTSVPTTEPTDDPTEAPTSSPTFGTLEGSVGNLILKLSVVHVPSDPEIVASSAMTAADILSGRAPALVSAVLGSLLAMLCREMNVRVVAEPNIKAPNFCNSGRELQSNVFDGESIIVSTARLDVKDNADEETGLTWTEWAISYPVLQVGYVYLQTAIQNSNGQEMSSEELSEEALNIFQSVARLALSAETQDQTLDADWPPNFKASIVGMETEMYAPEATPENQDGYWDPLDPGAMHALRVAGIIMMLTTLSIAFAMLKIAKRRRLEREWDEEYKEKGHGGLVTEAGVDYILEAGRRESLKVNSVGDQGENSGTGSPSHVAGTDMDLDEQLPEQEPEEPQAPLEQEQNQPSSILNLGNAAEGDERGSFDSDEVIHGPSDSSLPSNSRLTG